CLTPSADADLNLMHEGVALHRIVRVGNIMIDTLLAELPRAQALRMWERLEVEPRQFGVVTLHRPSNVDEPRRLRAIVEVLCGGARKHRVPELWDGRTAERVVEAMEAARLIRATRRAA